MSRPLISRNADLARLRDEGYDVEIRAGHVLLKSVPYVTSERKVARGTLVSEVSLAGDNTVVPSSHTVHFDGEYPCDQSGAPIESIRHSTAEKALDGGLIVRHMFSSKPKGGYKDHHDKLTTYATILSSPARAMDPTVTPMTFPAVEREDDDSVFNYVDTASSRAEIVAVSRKLELACVAIVGTGGTGSYVLDLVAKTPVKEIHIFDGDVLSQHNAFRSPGAASLEELRQRPRKVDYLLARYSPMRRGIVVHRYHLDATRVEELRGMDFAFICIDGSPGKQALLEKIADLGVRFIDCGMGLQQVDGSLGGILRVTTVTDEKRDHIQSRIGASGAVDDDYSRNIQVADLNALNAVLAVIKWKKLFGFYRDTDREHHSTYTIDGNLLLNDERLCPASNA